MVDYVLHLAVASSSKQVGLRLFSSLFMSRAKKGRARRKFCWTAFYSCPCFTCTDRATYALLSTIRAKLTNHATCMDKNKTTWHDVVTVIFYLRIYSNAVRVKMLN